MIQKLYKFKCEQCRHSKEYKTFVEAKNHALIHIAKHLIQRFFK